MQVSRISEIILQRVSQIAQEYVDKHPIAKVIFKNHEALSEVARDYNTRPRRMDTGNSDSQPFNWGRSQYNSEDRRTNPSRNSFQTDFFRGISVLMEEGVWFEMEDIAKEAFAQAIPYLDSDLETSIISLSNLLCKSGMNHESADYVSLFLHMNKEISVNRFGDIYEDVFIDLSRDISKEIIEKAGGEGYIDMNIFETALEHLHEGGQGSGSAQLVSKRMEIIVEYFYGGDELEGEYNFNPSMTGTISRAGAIKEIARKLNDYIRVNPQGATFNLVNREFLPLDLDWKHGRSEGKLTNLDGVLNQKLNADRDLLVDLEPLKSKLSPLDSGSPGHLSTQRLLRYLGGSHFEGSEFNKDGKLVKAELINQGDNLENRVPSRQSNQDIFLFTREIPVTDSDSERYRVLQVTLTNIVEVKVSCVHLRRLNLEGFDFLHETVYYWDTGDVLDLSNLKEHIDAFLEDDYGISSDFSNHIPRVN